MPKYSYHDYSDHNKIRSTRGEFTGWEWSSASMKWRAKFETSRQILYAYEYQLTDETKGILPVPSGTVDRQEWRILNNGEPGSPHNFYPSYWDAYSHGADLGGYDLELQTRFVNNDPKFEEDIEPGTYDKLPNGTIVTHWQFLQCNQNHSLKEQPT